MTVPAAGRGAAGDRVTWVGHATTLIELGGVRLLTDPVLRDRVLHIRRHGPSPPPQVAERIDAVLVSHLHPDHLDPPTLRGLGGDVPLIVPRGGGRTLARRGFRRVVEVSPGEETTVGDVRVVATRAVHDGRRYPIGRRVEALGYELRDRRAVYFAGDTDLFDEMEEMAGRIDVALLPVGGWGPRLRGRHLDCNSAAEAAAMIRPRVAVPIHWGSLLRIGLARARPELLSEPGREFAAQLARLAPEVDSRVLEPGESLSL